MLSDLGMEALSRVVPDLRLVAAFTGWNVGDRMEQPFEMMQRFVVPAADAR